MRQSLAGHDGLSGSDNPDQRIQEDIQMFTTNTVDLAIMVDVYHEFDHPYEMMRGIVNSLRPGGRVVLVEYRGEEKWIPIKPLHKMTEEQVKREMALHPLEWVETLRVLPRQHILIFRRPE